MKYIKSIILLCLISFSKTCCAKVGADTITNWQIYHGSQLLFSSNEVDCYKLTGIIKKNDNFKELKISFFRDTKSYGKQKIKLFSGKNVLVEFDFENKDELEIAKNDMLGLFKKTKQYLTIMYYDQIEPKGILLGYLSLEN